MLLVHCGFSLTNLLSEPENNSYVEIMSHLIAKLELYVKCVEQISKAPDSPEKEKYYKVLVRQVKTFVKQLSEIQHSESLLMYSTLDRYVSVLASMLFQSEIYPVRLQKLGLIAIYRVVNTTIYNLGNKNDGGHSEQGGILVSPVKFKNFEP